MGMGPAREKDFGATSTRADFAKNLKLVLTPPSLWAGRREPLSMDYIKLRQRKSGESRLVATVSLPDICARLARVASRINALCGSDVRRTNELVRVVKDWQQATELKYASPSRPWKALGWDDEVQRGPRKRGERVHCG